MRELHGCFPFRKLKAKRRKSVSPHKMVVVGSCCVGKSALIARFVFDEFTDNHEPTTAESYTISIELDQKVDAVNILDTAGQELYDNIRDNYLRTADGFLCVFSVLDRESLWAVRELREHILRVRHDIAETPLILVGNKADLDDKRQVSVIEAEMLARRWNVPYIETSAKTPANSDEAFSMLMRAIRTRKESLANGAIREHGDAKEKQSRKKGICTVM